MDAAGPGGHRTLAPSSKEPRSGLCLNSQRWDSLLQFLDNSKN